ncbi:MAG: orotidine-5'-phosphate decarboxylase [Spirochaetales bacterium]|nr:orotidine-5'-phosphate decarboxylase [Spirochaetales bacterium]
MNFFTQLENRIEVKGTLLCIGLDPSITIESSGSIADTIFDYNKKIIEQTAEYTLCYKPNIAFYEQYGSEGIRALEKTLTFIPEEIPVILDAKRSDIGNTAKAYAKSVFGHFKADAVTLNPYMGRESIQPFLDWNDKGCFLLCRTSNPGAAEIQFLQTMRHKGETPEKLYIRVAKLAEALGPANGIVVAGNDPESLRSVRAVCPDVWILAPGIGAQGGTISDAIINGAREDGKGIIPVVVRHIIEDADPGKKAKEYHEAIGKALEEKKKIKSSGMSQKQLRKKNLIKRIIQHGCFKVGTFTLKSGDLSPFYIDLRRLISDPVLLSEVADAYCELLAPLVYSRVAAIPVASVPVGTAICLKTGEPMIYPRIPVKKHGSGAPIDGEYTAGETVVLVDDLISAGVSKAEALEVLRAEKLVVKDLVVFIERGTRGRKELEQYGVTLHAYTTIQEILEVLKEMNGVTEAEMKAINDFLTQ